MNSQIIETRIAKVWLGEDEIICAEFRNASEITLQDGQETVAAIISAGGGRQRPLLADFTGTTIRSVERAARMSESYPALPAAVSAIGVITTSPAVQITINFVIRFYPGQSNMRLFIEEAKALEWLKKYL